MISKLGWIKQKQTKFQNQQRETPRDYIDRESHYVWGQRYLLKVIEHDAPPKMILGHSEMVLQVRPRTSHEQRNTIIESWYREQLKLALPPLIEKWQLIMGVVVKNSLCKR